jgi:competence protein ComEA
MPTPSEQKALTFVAIVILLGGAVRVLRAGPSTPTELEQQALARQATAADSASAKPKAGKKGRKPVRIETAPHVVAGVASVSPSYARPDQPFATSPYGFPPPGPRIDTDARGAQPRAAVASVARPGGKTPPAARIDLDVATEKEIEALPRVGPALAQRIVANRDSLGPFKSLEALRRVKGVGAATIALFEPLVSFSGRPAPPARRD